VILHKKGHNPIITKDGVTVAGFVDLEDPFENAGAQILKQVAAQTNSLAGDGTTTSTVLARAILEMAQKYLISGAAPVELKRGIDAAVSDIVEYLGRISTPVVKQEDIKNIAKISANGDETISELISMAIDQAGRDGSITIKDSRSMETTLEIVEGFRFDSGYFAKAFVNDERRNICMFDDALMLITDHKINLVEDIYPTLEIIARDNRPLVIVAEEVEGQALASLIMNTTRGTLKIVAVKAPRYGEDRRNIMKDLCVATGAKLISRASGIKLKDVKLEHLGSCKTIEVSRNLTTIVDGGGLYREVEEQIEVIKNQMKEEDNLRMCEAMQERITRLASGIAIINVGAPTEVEMIEKKHRIEDALGAVKAAQEEGILPGGGVALVRASEYLEIEGENEDQDLGIEIIREAVKAPLRQMAINAGKSPDIILNIVENESDGVGYDFSTGCTTDMFESGIVDPTRVTRVALQNAASAASTLITTGHAIIEV
tara:strand:+ start:19864 stop:21324 length:1461 start_codon:yes stop_codon:yes gene_type:complete